MAKKNSNLRLGEWWDYTPFKLNQQSEAALRAEYARLRKIALARGAALARSEFADTKSAKRVIGQFKTPASKLSKRELVYELHELATVTTSQMTSVRGLQKQRRETIATLKLHGYNIKPKDLEKFGEFMDDLRDFYGRRALDSARTADLFAIAQRRGISTEELYEDFDYWVEHTDKLKHARIHNPDGSVRTAHDYRMLFDGARKGRKGR